MKTNYRGYQIEVTKRDGMKRHGYTVSLNGKIVVDFADSATFTAENAEKHGRGWVDTILFDKAVESADTKKLLKLFSEEPNKWKRRSYLIELRNRGVTGLRL